MQKEQERAERPERKSNGILFYCLLGIVAVATGVLVGYFSRGGETPLQLAVKEPAPASETTGIRNLVRHKQPQPVENIAFVDAEGKPKHLSDWRGKVVLLNLWATWCAPCKLEMPSLDRLQAALGSKDFTVVALSTDRTGRKEPAAFLAKAGIKNLALYNDETAEASFKLKADGLPLSIILNPDGEEVARLVGPAQWDSPEAIGIVRSFFAKS